MRGYSEDESRRLLLLGLRRSLQHLRNHGLRVRVPKEHTITRWSMRTYNAVRRWLDDPKNNRQPRVVRMTHHTDGWQD
jgi:hypothetical protein